MIGAVPVWASPAAADQTDVASTECFRTMPGCALSRVELPEERHVISVIQLPL